MKNVKFCADSGEHGFSYEGIDEDEPEGFFEYHFSLQSLWDNISLDDFDVELLVNPLLNRESNVYELRGEHNKTVGYVFPVSLLDSDSDFSEYRNINNYVFVAFYELLKRIPGIKNENVFSENFEENICVCVFHKPSVNIAHPLKRCIHSLRKYGYSYFEPNNRIKSINGYKAQLYFADGNRTNRIKLVFKEPSLYRNSMIDSILRSLPKADNLTHRFVLLYQVIETLFEELSFKKIDEEITKFRNDQIPSNDFQENIKKLSSERSKISDIFDDSNVETSGEAQNFKESCIHLFDLIHYKPSREGVKDIFYSFRNQMTHSYRKLLGYHDELAETTQYFELLVLKIIEKYPYLK